MAEMIPTEDLLARRALRDELASFDCRITQPDDPPLFTREPKPTMKSLIWRARDIMPLLERIGREIALEGSGPRRTLRLHNPGLPYGTTNTFWASIQIVHAGEVATAHRHSANAFRFVMQGAGVWTTVDGECYPMNVGDLVLTPAGKWHDHVHKGDAPMVWLDVLDISIMKFLQATFFDPFEDRIQPIDTVPDRSFRQFGSGLMRPPGATIREGENPLLAYPAEMARKALESASGLPEDPFDDVVLEYRNPADGGPVMPTMGVQMQILRPKFVGKRRRHTGSKLFYVVEGAGKTVVGEETLEWSAGDFFVIAPWAWHSHTNTSSSDARLFQVNDLPTVKGLGYFREERES